ncbi:MAG: hypothetical protein ACFFER_09540 [Candidatus Thorarchaeota archaeon]
MNSDRITFDMSEDENRSRARGIAEIRDWFRWYFEIYFIVNAGLFAIWYELDH